MARRNKCFIYMTVILELSLLLGLSLYSISNVDNDLSEYSEIQLTDDSNNSPCPPSEMIVDSEITDSPKSQPKPKAKQEIAKCPVSSNIGGPYTVAPALQMSIYNAKKGDNLAIIAKDNDLDFFTILSVNRLESSNKISIGQKLRIPNQRGIIHTMSKGESIEDIALRYNVNIRKIIRVNQILDPSEIGLGMELFIPDAKTTLDFQKDLLVKSGVESEKKERIEKEEKNSRFRAVNNRVKKSSKSRSNDVLVFNDSATGDGISLIMPCDTNRVSSQFGYRRDPFNGRRAYHAGTDIDTEYGADVRASMSGTVTYAGWMGGYGKLIVITDKNGYSTRYGHLSRINVKKGSQIKQGQLLGTVGSTGRSTGAHLHFEVRKNDKPLNPSKMLNLQSKVSKNSEESKNIQEELSPPDKDDEKTVSKSSAKKSSKKKK